MMMSVAAVEQLRRKKKKRRRVESPSSSSGLMSLPYDMVLNCLARVSRSDLGALSLVSKSIHSLVASPEMYETRSRMGLREECIYVCLGTNFGTITNPLGWFILRRKGNNRLIPIPIPSFPSPRRATYVSMGCGIYVIGGRIEAVTTSRVSFLDCRTHTWSELPSMRFARCEANAGVLDGKIYVMGGCDDPFSRDNPEVFDPMTQTWSSVCIPDPVMSKEACRVVGPDNNYNISFKFRSEEGLWNDFFLNARDDDACCCAIDRLLFTCDFDGRIKWCDPWSGMRKGSMEWYTVNGLDDLRGFLKFDTSNINSIIFDGECADVWNCHMLNRGYTNGLLGLVPGFKISKSAGNIVIFWSVLVGDKLQVWCAEISLERRLHHIWGNIQCTDHVFTADPDLYILSTINVSL
ncbi:F-box/kelch-repeat protein At4g33900-like isoform X1 [Raphanus sativus]|uniref:F-box/kelch-repeat protein At4g33900-like isoform X1 n=1 Tax=Raphanus sativus TaxID=3726 RepID=A0A9W3DA87_RAPSA|nr:F-box/kelch-repeat protein At4g33900-like isoform X1 [Raphanus sativus]